MARIRTVKPEFWGDPKTSRCSRDARLLFLGLLNESDDEGRQLGNPRRIAGAIFPNDDDVTPKMVGRWLDELENARYIDRYDIENVAYLLVVGFEKHQKISHPTPSRLPPPPEKLRNVSGETPETFRSVSAPDLGSGSRNSIIKRSAPENSANVSADNPPDDDKRIVEILQSRIVKRMQGRTIANPAAYAQKIDEELGVDDERTRRLCAEFPDAPATVIAAHLDGEANTLIRYRRQEQTA